MSICPYNKSIKTSTSSTPTNNPNRKLKDDRLYSNSPQRGAAKKPFSDGRKGQANQRNFRGQQHRSLGQRREDRFEKYAPGNSYVQANGNVKESSKKVSLNHLLNFKFESRATEDFSPATRPKYKRGYRKNSSVSAFNKERFLQANCQFVVSADGDYSIHFTDPDVPIPWDKVEQVEIEVDDEIFCPICLYPPSVAKITKCGHVYCWHCILHYLALDDGKRHTRECPICNVDVHKNDLRSVSIHERIPMCIGTEVEMVLMFTETGSLIPQPVVENDEDCGSDGQNKGKGGKITKLSPSQILDVVVEPELSKLKKKLGENLEDLEREFVNSAVKECESRKEKVLDDISKQSNDETSRDCRANSCSSSDLSDSNETSVKKSSGDELRRDTGHYFYQSKDGSHSYLDGLNVKCFLKEYGSFARCPPLIKANLVHLESFVMTEELRKRHKYLSHLPLSCEYRIVELDLKTPVISQDTLDEFKVRIQRRVKTRQNKERQEDDSRKRAEYEECQRMRQFFRDHSFRTSASAIAANIGGTGSISVLMEANATAPVAAEPRHGSLSPTSSECSVSPNGFLYSSSSPMSFAQMLRTGETAIPKPQTSKLHGEQKSSTRQENAPKTRKNSDDEEEDPYYTPPAFQSSFGDALNAALDDLSISSAGGGTNTRKTKGGRKQKKKKQTLLFSTSVQMHP